MNCRLFHENLSRLVWAMLISLRDMRLSPPSPGLPSPLVLKYYRLLPVHLFLSRRGHNGEMAAMELPLFLDKVGLPLLNLCSPYNQVGHCMQHIMSMYRRVGEARLGEINLGRRQREGSLWRDRVRLMRGLLRS